MYESRRLKGLLVEALSGGSAAFRAVSLRQPTAYRKVVFSHEATPPLR